MGIACTLELKLKQERIRVLLVTASSGPTTSQAPYSPTVDTTSSPTYTSSPGCKDISDSVCRKLMSWNFCHSSKYDEDIRKLICPQSCKLC
ncbi:hypothetical protein KIN20_031895 [Parelaphostrongylus tenuis]|uniref:ShKT domain-containing protein n=1 Tax=Parelaphostrongylus tenuis TaxID=148309 RepID=A0AAD5R638_PARTN|nr:hypothetical protein KIN20_031895 [Parelaphostrongylus tenuis]